MIRIYLLPFCLASMLAFGSFCSNCSKTAEPSAVGKLPVEEEAPHAALPSDPPSFVAAKAVLLKSDCASCHRSSLLSFKAGAIAIFDLDKERWHEGMQTEEHFAGMEKRVMNSEAFSGLEKSHIQAFLDCKRKKDGM